MKSFIRYAFEGKIKPEICEESIRISLCCVESALFWFPKNEYFLSYEEKYGDQCLEQCLKLGEALYKTEYYCKCPEGRQEVADDEDKNYYLELRRCVMEWFTIIDLDPDVSEILFEKGRVTFPCKNKFDEMVYWRIFPRVLELVRKLTRENSIDFHSKIDSIYQQNIKAIYSKK